MILFFRAVLHLFCMVQKGNQKIEILHEGCKIIGQYQVALAEILEQHIVKAFLDAVGTRELKKLA